MRHVEDSHAEMRILLVDDEPLARQRMRRLLEELPEATAVKEAENGQNALRLAFEWQPDVVLLDIRMPGMDGLQVARQLASLEHPPAVIFTTAFDSHAMAAFEAQAVGYLLKPVRKERLQQAIQGAARPTRVQLNALRTSSASTDARSHISATLGGKLHLIPVRDILYFQADQKYVSVHHRDGEVLIEESLKALEQEFSSQFVRIHRNALVAVAHICAMGKDAYGSTLVSLREGDARLEVSRRHVVEVRARLKI